MTRRSVLAGIGGFDPYLGIGTPAVGGTQAGVIEHDVVLPRLRQVQVPRLGRSEDGFPTLRV